MSYTKKSSIIIANQYNHIEDYTKTNIITQTVKVKNCPNVVSECEFGTCSKKVVRMFLFSNGKANYFCGLNSHMCDGFANLSEDLTMSMYTKKGSSFVMEKGCVTCFDVSQFPNVLYQPLNKQDTIWKEYCDIHNQMDKKHRKMEKEYPSEEREAKSNELVEIRQLLDNIQEDDKYSSQVLNKLSESEEEIQNYFIEFNKRYKEYCIPTLNKFLLAEQSLFQEFAKTNLTWLQNNNDTTCNICMESVNEKTGGHIKCGHCFHNECVKKMAMSQTTPTRFINCPSCKFSFDKYNLFQKEE